MRDDRENTLGEISKSLKAIDKNTKRIAVALEGLRETFTEATGTFSGNYRNAPKVRFIRNIPIEN